jgi:chorismate mutase
MDNTLNLDLLRSEIDKIDHQIIELINERQKAILKVAEYKKTHELPIFSPARENDVFKKVEEQIGTKDSNGVKLLYGILMDLQKYSEYQTVSPDISVPTGMGGASVRAVIDDTPFALCRYLSPLAVADVSILSIRSQAMPGGRLLVDLELSGNTSDPSFSSVLAVLADAAQKFTLL